MLPEASLPQPLFSKEVASPASHQKAQPMLPLGNVRRGHAKPIEQSSDFPKFRNSLSKKQVTASCELPVKVF
jgi:hypothetical protein